MTYLHPSIHAEMLDCRDHLLRALTAAMEARVAEHVDDWTVVELTALRDACEAWDGPNKRSVPSMIAIGAADRVAMGHVDYASKVCLYVAEMMYGLMEFR